MRIIFHICTYNYSSILRPSAKDLYPICLMNTSQQLQLLRLFVQAVE